MKMFSHRLKSTLAAAATAVMVGLGSTQSADASLIFQYSFTNDPVIGNVAGTVTGKIFGLVDNATTAATSITIESFPAGLGGSFGAGSDAVLWAVQQLNSFTVANKVVTSYDFFANTFGPTTYDALLLSSFANLTPSCIPTQAATSYLTRDGGTTCVARNLGLPMPTITLVQAPEPGTLATLGLGVFALAMVRRRRIA